MTRLRYIGLKSDGERAFEAKTGIVWMPGSEHEVSTEHAAQMLPHDDVWELAEGPQAADIGTTSDSIASGAHRVAELADEAAERNTVTIPKRKYTKRG